MRIAFVTPEFVTESSRHGGLANYLGRVSVALAQHGHEVHVYTCSNRTGTLSHEGVDVHRVVPLWDRRMILDHADPWVPRRYYNPYQDLKAAWCLARRVKRDHRRQPFDVIQAANVSAVGMFLRRLRGVPVIVRLSNYRPDCDAAAGYPLDAGTRARWKLEERSIRDRKYVFAPSPFVAERVQRVYGLDRVDVIESPYFNEVVESDRRVLEEVIGSRPFAVYFGTLSQLKGVHVLAHASNDWLAACPQMHLVLIGRDSIAPDGASMHAFVRDAARQHRDRVHILDSLNHEQLYPFVDAAQFVVLPSLVDNLPNTLLESMGHGKVVIGTTGSSFEQLIDDGVSGFLVPPGDASQLARAMIKVSRLSVAERVHIGDEARLRVARLHPDVAVPRLIAYYEWVRQDHLSPGSQAVSEWCSAS